MRPGVVLIAAVLALPAAVLAAAPAAAPAAARPSDQLTLSGHLTVIHDDSGLESNGASCGLNTPDNTSPFADHYSLTVSWQSRFVVPIGRHTRAHQTVAAAGTHLTGSFTYNGYAYDLTCQQIVYGPGGQPCTGTLTGGALGSVDVRWVPHGRRVSVKVLPTPFGPLTGAPPSCTVGDTPQVTYTASDELSLSTLGADVALRTFTLRQRPTAGKPIHHRIRRYSNCSLPAESDGETDNCSTAYLGTETLRVRSH